MSGYSIQTISLYFSKTKHSLINSNVFNKVEQPSAWSSGRQESDGFAIFIVADRYARPEYE